MQQRIETAKAMLDLLRMFSAGLVPPDRFGAQAGDLVLFAGLLIGTAEGRPMNASKLAQFVGIPRPSVIRKLGELVSAGKVVRQGGGFILAPSLLDDAAAIEAGKAAAKRITRAAALIAAAGLPGAS